MFKEIVVGTILPVRKGVHNQSNSYKVLNIVEDGTGSVEYQARKDVPINIPLTNTEYWVRITGSQGIQGVKGEQGIKGLKGDKGVSITGITVDADGKLIVTTDEVVE
jgi:hypothetical protein